MLVAFVSVLTATHIGLLAAASLGLVSIVWWQLSAIVGKLPPSFKNMIIFYLYYDDNARSFFPSYTSIPELLKAFNTFGLGDNTGLRTVALENLIDTIKAHPFRFALYVGREGLNLCKVVTLSFLHPTRKLYEAIPLGLAVTVTTALLACGTGQTYWQWTHTVFILYLATSILFNELWVRHIMIVMPPIIVLFLIWLFQAVDINHVLARFMTPIFLFLLYRVVAYVRFVIKVRARTENAGYEHIFKILRPLVTNQTVVMSRCPQLFAYALGCVNVGTTFVIESIELYIAKFHPEFIVLDTMNEGSLLLRTFHNRFGGYVPGYKILASSPDWGIIMKKDV